MKCNGVSGVHRFEARFDLSPANGDILNGISLKGANPIEFMEKFRAKTYVRDVCVKCGATIERNPS